MGYGGMPIAPEGRSDFGYWGMPFWPISPSDTPNQTTPNKSRKVQYEGMYRASFSTTHAHTANVLDLAASVASPVAGAPRTAWAPRTARRKNFGPIVIIQSQRSWHGLRRCRRRCCSCVVSLRGRRPTMDYEVLPDFSGAKRPAVMQQCSSTHPSSDASIAAATLSVQPNRLATCYR